LPERPLLFYFLALQLKRENVWIGFLYGPDIYDTMCKTIDCRNDHKRED
jgi:hypothetical protein